jgi:hypothetical protein
VARSLGEDLVDAGLIDAFQLKSVEARLKQWGGSLLWHLVETRMVADADVAAFVGKLHSHQVVMPLPMLIEKEVLALLDGGFCKEHQALPIDLIDGRTLSVVLADPSNLAMIDDLRAKVGKPLHISVSGPLEIAKAINVHYFPNAEDPVQPIDAGALMGEDVFGGAMEGIALEEPGGRAASSPTPAPLHTPSPRSTPAPVARGDIGEVAFPEVVEVGDLFGDLPKPEKGPDSNERTVAWQSSEATEEDRAETVDPSAAATARGSNDPTGEVPEGYEKRAQLHATQGQMMVMASEPIGAQTPDADAAGSQATAKAKVRAKAKGGGKTLGVETPPQPAMGAGTGAMQRSVQQTQSLARQVGEELRELVDLLVEKEVFTREEFRDWLKRKRE